MSRQINPHIFGENMDTSQTGSSFAPLPMMEEGVSLKELGEIHEKLEKQKYETDQVLKSLSVRLDKGLQKASFLEERLNYIIKEVNERLTFVMTQVKEKSFSETKIEALIERHNQIVQSFELRISQSQKLIENQSLQLSKQQTLIDDARRQIEKLKRL
jgi:hypothetical protein